MGDTLKDFGFIVYFMTINDIRDYEVNKPNSLAIYLHVVAFLPFWFRFAQCLNKYYYTRLNAHLYNAGKYFSKLVVPFVLIMNSG